eukprot:CAMPEP_0181491614 /NCGR_PEP_ID=MMETSP1110-20121109/50234_1 /TAXON_ID=174948 /ORGANISM="Symbiodinium sp., Strain CCMP421" /LENGTH=31 /DNA_ID= /DNA_START= /DNA_END= /DNA_ORIENTATION=
MTVLSLGREESTRHVFGARLFPVLPSLRFAL